MKHNNDLDILLEEFISDVPEDEFINNDNNNVEEAVPQYGVYILSEYTERIMRTIENCNYAAAARKVAVLQRTATGIRDIKICASVYHYSSIEDIPLDDAASYKQLKNKSYGLYIKFNLPSGAKIQKTELFTRALVSIYKIAVDLVYGIYGVPYPYKVRDSFYIASSVRSN